MAFVTVGPEKRNMYAGKAMRSGSAIQHAAAIYATAATTRILSYRLQRIVLEAIDIARPVLGTC